MVLQAAVLKPSYLMIKGFCGHITINLIQTFITLFPKLLPVNLSETPILQPLPTSVTVLLHIGSVMMLFPALTSAVVLLPSFKFTKVLSSKQSITWPLHQFFLTQPHCVLCIEVLTSHNVCPTLSLCFFVAFYKGENDSQPLIPPIPNTHFHHHSGALKVREVSLWALCCQFKSRTGRVNLGGTALALPSLPLLMPRSKALDPDCCSVISFQVCMCNSCRFFFLYKLPQTVAVTTLLLFGPVMLLCETFV